MSYEKVKHIKIEKDKVLINSACNNVRPLSYSYEEYPYFTKILKEKGREELDIALLRNYEEGNLQGGVNKYTRALNILYYLFKEEYSKFDWRNHNSKYNSEGYKKERELRESEEFKELLKKALNTKLPKKRFILSKINNGYDYSGEVYLRKCISSAYWTREKAEAKKFRFKEELENIKSNYHGGENWEIEEIGGNKLNELKERKNILFISDNFSKHHFKSLKDLIERRNVKYDNYYLGFELFLAERFSRVPKGIKFDAIFIDYGFIDNCFNRLKYCLKIIDDFHHKERIPLVWCGGLPTKYNNDAKIIFPKIKYFHNLLSCSVSHDEVFHILKLIFEKEKEVEK